MSRRVTPTRNLSWTTDSVRDFPLNNSFAHPADYDGKTGHLIIPLMPSKWSVGQLWNAISPSSSHGKPFRGGFTHQRLIMNVGTSNLIALLSVRVSVISDKCFDICQRYKQYGYKSTFRLKIHRKQIGSTVKLERLKKSQHFNGEIQITVWRGLN